MNFEFRNDSIAISKFFDLEILDKIKKFSYFNFSFLFVKFFKSIACPMTLTLCELKGKEFLEAVTILSEANMLKNKIIFFTPNLGPGCVNHKVVLILFLLNR